MTGPRGSRADIELVAALRSRGVTVSARQLDRWRGAGLMLPSVRRGLGQGHGSRSSHAPGAVRRAAEIVGILEKHRSLDAVAMVLYLRGRDVSEAVARRAFVGYLDRLERAIRSRGKTSDDAVDVLAMLLTRSSARSPIGRSLHAAAEDLGGSTNGILISTYTNLLTIVLEGSATSEDGLAEALQVAGVAEIDRRLGALDGLGAVAQDALPRVFGDLSLAALRDTAEAFPASELTAARDRIRDLLPWLPAILAELDRAGVPLPPLHDLDEPTCAVLVLWLARLSRLYPTELTAIEAAWSEAKLRWSTVAVTDRVTG